MGGATIYGTHGYIAPLVFMDSQGCQLTSVFQRVHFTRFSYLATCFIVFSERFPGFQCFHTFHRFSEVASLGPEVQEVCGGPADARGTPTGPNK